MQGLVALWLFLFLFFFSYIPNEASDEQSLTDLKRSISSDPLNVLANWLPGTTFCNWTGVTCDSTGTRVQSLVLSDMQLGGSISPSIGNLSYLTQLDLFNNSFGGQIPHELGRLQSLQLLYLSGNVLEGYIPKNLTACKQLKELSLAYNHLAGSIPSEIGGLTNLEVLQLGSNNFTGNIPPSIANLRYLKTLFMQDNVLEGHIPTELGMLSSLGSFLLFENPLLRGPIPWSFSNMSNLVELALFSNSLSGSIPPELGKLSKLRILYLWDNQLSGSIPVTLANCSQLHKLDLELNRLTGSVPLELSRLSNLKTLSLSSNRLVSGSSRTIPILEALRNCTSLNQILIHDNHLTGSLPEQFPKNLSLLSLRNNNITGSIPSHIANITNLIDLDLSYNLLTGHIPSSLRILGKLQRLWLDNNKLEGNIPNEIAEMTSLGKLSLSHNMLSGEIPDTISGLQQLRDLEIHHNQLSGKISTSLGTCYKLELLDLSHNKFSGRIPPEVASLSNLQFYFNLSGNSLQGSLPSEIGNMIHVLAIDVSGNKLEGRIPAALGSCEQLQYLNLSSNGLVGPIPKSLGRLGSLVGMDLSWNNLSGSIPASQKSWKMLQSLNLSFNNFSGEIPEEGVFRNLTAASFMGNPYLCGEWMHHRPCSSYNRSTKDHSNRITIIAPVAGAIAFLLCFLLILGLIYRRRKINSGVPTDMLTLDIMDDRGTSYKEIIKATDGFNQKNLLGAGSFGSVYRGIFSDGTVAAVKLLDLQNESASKSFIKECKILREVRHRNLVKVISFCFEIGRKMLVLEFMSKGNLEELLQSNSDVLNFMEILNIAIDVAHGLEYLHHDCFLLIVHCDIKPSNILLDEDMTAHVADFGIAQIICGSDSMEPESASSLALKGSMGYIAPEYGFGGKASTKGDIYSYGIMLLQMITGMSPTDHIFSGELNLHKWASIHVPEKVEEIVDKRIIRDSSEFEIMEGVIPLISIGLQCSKEWPNDRPTAREVAGTLKDTRAALLRKHSN